MNKWIITAIAAVLLSASAALAEDENKIIPGPKGGKVFATESLRAEFLVNADRTVTVTFYDKDMKPVAPDKQSVTVIAEAPDGKAKLELAARNGALSSTEPLPAGEGYRVIVQVRDAPESKPQNFRLDLIMSTCGECSRPEYACTCEHAGE